MPGSNTHTHNCYSCAKKRNRNTHQANAVSRPGHVGHMQVEIGPHLTCLGLGIGPHFTCRVWRDGGRLVFFSHCFEKGRQRMKQKSPSSEHTDVSIHMHITYHWPVWYGVAHMLWTCYPQSSGIDPSCLVRVVSGGSRV